MLSFPIGPRSGQSYAAPNGQIYVFDGVKWLGTTISNGGTTIVTNNIENPFSFSVAADDSTQRSISNNELVKFIGDGTITTTSDAEGNITITGSTVVANTYQFFVAADDSTQRLISTDEVIKFTGAGGITTTSDAEGNITITGTVPPTLATVATSGSYTDLINKPNIAGTYQFFVAADDSTQQLVSSDEVIKFIGAGGITTSSDAEGNITINYVQGDIKSNGNINIDINLADSTLRRWQFGEDGILTLPSTGKINNGNYEWQFGTDGSLTFPDGYLKVVPNGANPYISNRFDNGLGLVAGSAIQIRQSVADAYGITMDCSTTNTVGTSTLAGGSSIDVNGSKIVLGKYYYTSDVGSNLTSQNKIEINNDAILIGPYSSNTVDGSTVTAFTGWTFGVNNGTLTLPATGKISNSIYDWTFGTGGELTLPNGAVLRNTVGNAIAFGNGAGLNSQSTMAIAIGTDAGYYTQGAAAVAIGESAGENYQGANAIAIGKKAGYNNQVANSIIINATGDPLEQTTANTFTVKPVRQGETTNAMYYNSSTGEITYAEAFSFNVAADDSTQRAISNNELIKFIGAGGITTASDAEGNITITGSSGPLAMANLMGFTSTATAGGTTTLTYTSSYYQLFTGTLTQTIVLPVTSTLQTGWTFHICNNSSGTLTVNSSGGNLVLDVITGLTIMVTCIGTTLTTAADWEAGYTDFSTRTGTGSVVLSSSPTIGGTLSTTNISATGSINFNTTSSTISLGSASNTAVMTFGLSTVSQTTNIQAGATTSGSIKTINLGTGGLAGSTTNITIGSNSGGVNLIKLNGGLTFPDNTVQTTASPAFSFSVAADDSTQRLISTDELIKFTGAGGITTSSDLQGNITITGSAAAAGSLTGTALASGVVSSSLTSVGTLRTLAVTGTVTAESFNTDQITVVGNRISTTVTNANLELECNGTGGVVINTVADATTASTAASVGYLGLPQSATATSATLAMGDAGKHIYVTTASQTITIPAASSVAYPIGTTLTFIAGPSATTVSIAITTDTLRLAGGTSTGTRTLAANGMATAVKVSGTSSAGVWYINGTGLT
jgi:hypothetical protein